MRIVYLGSEEEEYELLKEKKAKEALLVSRFLQKQRAGNTRA